MPDGMLVIDVNIVHELAITYLQGAVAAVKSAQVDGAAAVMGEHQKEDEYRRDIDGGAYDWELCGHGVSRQAGQGAMWVI